MPPGRGVPLRYGAGACDIGCAGCDAGAERAVNATWVDCPHGYVLVDGDANAPGGHPPYPICQRPECVIDASAWLAGHLAAFAPLDSCTECDSDLGPEPIELRGPSNCPIATPLTPPHLLSVGLRAVAMALVPDRGLLDKPGGGNCTFHAWFDCLSRIPIAFTRPGLELPWIPESHSDMRAACVWHARRPDVRQRAIDLCGTQVTIGEFLKGTMAAWPRSVLQGRTPSADAWCTAMLQPNFWGDEGVHAIFCDLFHAFARAWWSSPSGVQAEAYLPAIGTTPPSPSNWQWRATITASRCCRTRRCQAARCRHRQRRRPPHHHLQPPHGLVTMTSLSPILALPLAPPAMARARRRCARRCARQAHLAGSLPALA